MTTNLEPVRLENMSATIAPTTDAKSGATLNGTSWLTDLLKTGITGYVAVETVKNQARQTGTVTTDAIPRIETAPASPAISPKVLYIVGGSLVVILLFVLFMGRRK